MGDNEDDFSDLPEPDGFDLEDPDPTDAGAGAAGGESDNDPASGDQASSDPQATNESLPEPGDTQLPEPDGVPDFDGPDLGDFHLDPPLPPVPSAEDAANQSFDWGPGPFDPSPNTPDPDPFGPSPDMPDAGNPFDDLPEPKVPIEGGGYEGTLEPGVGGGQSVDGVEAVPSSPGVTVTIETDADFGPTGDK